MKIDLGAGDPRTSEQQADGYTKQDIEPYEGIDIVCDIKELDKHVQKNSVEKFRASHVLEHFGHREIDGVLSMLHTLLIDRGELEVIVPNFAWHASLVMQGLDEMAVGYAFGGQLDSWDFHKNGFTPRTLQETLERNNFRVLELYDETSIICRAVKI